MLRLRRKQQKATARLTNFINKQTREDSITTSDVTDENRLSPVTGLKEEPWTSLMAKETPLNFLKNEQKNANKEENRHQNTSEKPQKDILVDSSYSHPHTTVTKTQQTIVHHITDHADFDLCFFWYIPFPRRDNCGVPRDPNKPHIKKIRLDFLITAINSDTTLANLQHIFTYFKEYPPPFVIIISVT